MAVDPKANQKFKDANTVSFSGTVWVNGVEFIVVGTDNNRLTLQPVSVKIS